MAWGRLSLFYRRDVSADRVPEFEQSVTSGTTRAVILCLIYTCDICRWALAGQRVGFGEPNAVDFCRSYERLLYILPLLASSFEEIVSAGFFSFFADRRVMLQIRHVYKAYREPDGGELPVLDIEALDLAAGEQLVLRGRSGGGKTTLLNAISGLSAVDRGEILINGVDITKLTEFRRDRFRARTIGFVFQTFNLLPAFTALENVLLGMTFTGQAVHSDRAKQLLEQVGLGHRTHHKPAALSVGEQQRVAVARALANQPVLLLADEPTANVDPGHQQQVIDLLRDACQQESVGMLLVTHAPEVSQQFERVLQLEDINRVVAAV